MDVSIIIVNYNTCELTRNCLKSIFEQTNDIDFEVIVADNDSHDGSVEMIKTEFPQVILIETGANLGFGRANNRGLAIAKGKYVFYLNSDTVLLNNAVKIFFDYFENDKTEEIGALGCNLLDKDQNFTGSGGNISTTKGKARAHLRMWMGLNKDFLAKFIPVLRKKRENVLNTGGCKPRYGELHFVTGADLFARNNEFAKFDENFFMYSEEVDLQVRMHKAGLKSFLIDGPRIIHLEGSSLSSSNKPLNIRILVNRALSQYIVSQKHDDYLNKTIGDSGRLWVEIFRIVLILYFLNLKTFRESAKYIPLLFKKY